MNDSSSAYGLVNQWHTSYHSIPRSGRLSKGYYQRGIRSSAPRNKCVRRGGFGRAGCQCWNVRAVGWPGPWDCHESTASRVGMKSMNWAEQQGDDIAMVVVVYFLNSAATADRGRAKHC